MSMPVEPARTSKSRVVTVVCTRKAIKERQRMNVESDYGT